MQLNSDTYFLSYLNVYVYWASCILKWDSQSMYTLKQVWFLHLHEIVEVLYFHYSLPVCVRKSVCLSVNNIFLPKHESEKQQEGNAQMSHKKLW